MNVNYYFYALSFWELKKNTFSRSIKAYQKLQYVLISSSNDIASSTELQWVFHTLNFMVVLCHPTWSICFLFKNHISELNGSYNRVQYHWILCVFEGALTFGIPLRKSFYFWLTIFFQLREMWRFRASHTQKIRQPVWGCFSC